jgi:hypothetical protein
MQWIEDKSILYYTFKKYRFGLQSGCVTVTLAVLAQADIPEDTAEMIFAP